MILINNTEVFNFEGAIRGMRNPLNSWDKSDSEWKYKCDALGPKEQPHYCNNCGYDMCHPYEQEAEFVIGPNDMSLMQKLIKAGSEHRKFMRQIMVCVDIVAPLYWWKEFDTYKVSTVANSCSTMHKIATKEFELDDFSHEHLDTAGLTTLNAVIERMNISRKYYHGKYDNVIAEDDKRDKKDYWWQMIQLLPSSYNQKRTWTGNYENLFTMYHQRKNHKLDEWNQFCDWIKTLPYAEELIIGESND